MVARRVRGEVVNQVPDDVDWPPVKAGGEAEWQTALAGLEAAHQDLRQAVAALDETRLDERPYPGASPRYVQIHGVIQHDLYHAGQMALLKKA